MALDSATVPVLLYLLHKPHGCGECRYCRSNIFALAVDPLPGGYDKLSHNLTK
jgi:hypothetical protein